jgi:hypothetical protein
METEHGKIVLFSLNDNQDEAENGCVLKMIIDIHKVFSLTPTERTAAFVNADVAAPPSQITAEELVDLTATQKVSCINELSSYVHVARLSEEQKEEAVKAPYIIPDSVMNVFYHKSLIPATAINVVEEAAECIGSKSLSCELLVIIGHGNNEFVHGPFTADCMVSIIQTLNPKAVIFCCCSGLEFGVNVVKRASELDISCPPLFGPFQNFLFTDMFSLQQVLAPLAGLCVNGGKITKGDIALELPSKWSEDQKLVNWAQMFEIADMGYKQFFHHCTAENLKKVQEASETIRPVDTEKFCLFKMCCCVADRQGSLEETE